MKPTLALLLGGLLLLAGCAEGDNGARAAKKEAEIKAALGELSPEDRQAALAQKYCALETENRLGSMGQPFKTTIDGKPVFFCCKGCSGHADRAKLLATVQELKEKARQEAAAPR
jgi:outer membrane murein-binding lipoprotein Lpp